MSQVVPAVPDGSSFSLKRNRRLLRLRRSTSPRARFRRPEPLPVMMQRLKNSLWIFDVGFRRMKADLPPGWAGTMLAFSLLALTMIAAVGLGMPLAWPLSIIGVIDLFVTLHFIRGFVGRIWRLGILGPTRARWWIEIAALDWTLCMSCGVFFITHGNPALALPAWQQAFADLAFAGMGHLFPPFLAFTVVGFLLGLTRGKRIRGRSLELVNFFFWLMVVIQASLLLVPEHPALSELVAPALAVLGVVALCAAGVVAATQRILQPSGGQGVKPSDVDRHVTLRP